VLLELAHQPRISLNSNISERAVNEKMILKPKSLFKDKLSKRTLGEKFSSK
jgi:hypothetical protein